MLIKHVLDKSIQLGTSGEDAGYREIQKNPDHEVPQV